MSTDAQSAGAFAGPTVLYDGLCGLCNRFVQFVLRYDRRKQLRFATLEGPVGVGARGQYPHTRDVDSIVLLRDNRAFVRSSAALRIFAAMGGLWPLVLVFLLVPSPLRDWVYNVIARNRYGWFGKLDACPIPDPAVRSRFLD